MATPQGPTDFESFEQWVSESERDGVNIVVVGETGVGKSTLINGLVGYRSMPTAEANSTATTGRGARSVTKKVEEYKGRSENVRIFDTPGFFDGETSIETIVEDVAKKTGGKIDLLVYCVGKMQDRITTNTKQGIGYVADILRSRNNSTPSWDNVLCVLTFANIYEVVIRVQLEGTPSGQGEQVSERVKTIFAEVQQDLRKAIHEDTQEVILEKHQIKPIDAAKIAGDIPVVTAGFRDTAIPGCDDWLSHLWRVAYSRVDAAAAPAFLNATAFHRLQREGEGPDRSKELPENRNIQVDELAEHLRKTGKGLAAGIGLPAVLFGLCTAGGALLGVPGGPVTIAGGAKAGAIIGAKVGLYVGSASSVLGLSYAAYQVPGLTSAAYRKWKARSSKTKED